VIRGDYIEIPMTDVSIDITQTNQSYFVIDVDIQLDLVAGFGGGTLPNLVNATEQQKMLWKRVFIFVGYKHATDAIQSIKLLHRTRYAECNELRMAVTEFFKHSPYILNALLERFHY
jgi:hypothetical protein